MPTTLQAALEAHVDGLLDADRTGALWRWLRETRDALRAGAYGPLAEALGQSSEVRGGATQYDAWAFGQLWHQLHTAKVFAVTVDVGAEPGPDVDRAGNQQRLTAGLPPAFTAEVSMRAIDADGDGTLAWSRPVRVHAVGCREKECAATLPASVVLAPGSAQLEIGTTSFARTDYHLRQERSVARWPYGSRLLYLFWRVKPFDPFAEAP